jgi:predicted metal-binding protein
LPGLEARDDAPGAGSAGEAAKLPFPAFIVCHSCKGRRRVMQREVFELPEGIAGVAWARCRTCRHTFVRFIGAGKPVARLAARWLGLQEK